MSLIAPRFKLAEYSRSIWTASVEHGVLPQTLLDPKYWAHVANQVKVGDRIEVMPESLEWFAELFVLEVGSNFARVWLLRLDPLTATTETATPQDTAFMVKWVSPTKKWAVIRLSDKAAIYEGLPSKDAAQAKLTAHLRPIAA